MVKIVYVGELRFKSWFVRHQSPHPSTSTILPFQTNAEDWEEENVFRTGYLKLNTMVYYSMGN